MAHRGASPWAQRRVRLSASLVCSPRNGVRCPYAGVVSTRDRVSARCGCQRPGLRSRLAAMTAPMHRKDIATNDNSDIIHQDPDISIFKYFTIIISLIHTAVRWHGSYRSRTAWAFCRPKSGVWPRLKRYSAGSAGGINPQSLVLEPNGRTNFNKRTKWVGYDTQKMLGLLDKLIRTSSDVGDLVLGRSLNLILATPYKYYRPGWCHSEAVTSPGQSSGSPRISPKVIPSLRCHAPLRCRMLLSVRSSSGRSVCMFGFRYR